MQYQRLGHAFIFGDLNARVGQRSDYITFDGPLQDLDDHSDIDQSLALASSDNGTNRYGERLLDLCKSLNMRTVNGRVGLDSEQGKPTCCTYNGESVIDYLITRHDNFRFVKYFCVNDFNSFFKSCPNNF